MKKWAKYSFCIAACSMMTNAYVFAQNSHKITVEKQRISVIDAIKAVEKQSKISINYNNSQLRQQPFISLDLKNVTVETALEEILKNTNFTYQKQGNYIVLIPKKQQQAPKEIKGTVVDEHGEPLTGVNIVIEGTSKGTVSDIDGNFSLKAANGNKIHLSYLGYKPYILTIGGKNTYRVSLMPDAHGLDEVVVTALGIKRSQKALTYNVQEIKSSEITGIKDANFINALNGKVAGVTINSSSSGIGGATRVVMRGPKSINYNNNALYVIDGIPMTNEGGQVDGVFASNTTSDNISSFNPEDIESLSVLTGAAASSLYGSLGQNGVILITTKSGKSGKPKLTYSNSTSFLTPFVMPEFQNTYGTTDEGGFSSWGEKLTTQSKYSPKNFFQTGHNFTNSVTFTTGTDKNQTYISAASMNAHGIIPSNKVDRYNFTFKNTSKLYNNKITLSYNMMYMTQKEQNMFAQGLYNNPIVPIYLFPPGGNFDAVKAYERFDGSRNFPTQFWPYADDQFRMQNPFWITNKEFFINRYSRLFLGMNLKWDVFSWLSLAGRAKLEKNDSSPETKLYASTNPLFAGESGRFYRGRRTTEQYYFDFLATINKTFAKDYTLVANLGYTFTENKNSNLSVESWIPKGSIPNLFNTGNALGIASSYIPTKSNFQALFGTAELSYKEMIYLNASLRYDWWSQLYGTGKLYIAYPSFGTSIILSNIFKINPDIISYAKIRANYTNVGNPPPAFVTGEQTYPVSAGSPDFGNGIKPSLKLQPEKTKGYEVGLNLKFWKNHFNLDLTLYSTDTYNQIFNVPISASSFYSSFYINAGKVNNKGIEAALGFNSSFGKCKWETNATFTLNRNKVENLIKDYYDEDTKTYITRDMIEKGGSGSYSMKVRVGGSLSDVYTTTLQYDDQDRYVVVKGGKVSSNDKNYIFAGQAAPDYSIGLRNSFTWKNFNLNFSINGRFGGIVVSGTQAMMDAFGVSKASADARDRGYVRVNGYELPGVKDYYTVMGNGLNGVLSEYVYSATNIRLRDLSIGYTLPGKWFNNYVQNINVALTGQNLFMFYNKAPFDPETTASTGTYYQGFDFFMQPSLRSMGFNIKIQF